MAFFFNQAKVDGPVKPVRAKTGRKADIPIASLRQLGCSVCPRDTDSKLKSPKMVPAGVSRPAVYLLGTNPTERDDEEHKHWTGVLESELRSKFGKEFMSRQVRSGHITQCHGDQTVVEIECCRNRVVSDIERSQPTLIVGIGDVPLKWATQASGTSLNHRGSVFQVKIGTHFCFYYPVLSPNYLHKKKSYNKSEYELTFEHDVAAIKAWLGQPAQVIPLPSKLDAGIELITGQEPQDFQRLESALNDLSKATNSAVDIETNGLRPYFLTNPQILTASVGTFARTVAFPVDHPDGWGTEARIKRVRGLLSDYLMESGRKAAHNLSFELEWFHYFFGERLLWLTEWDDTMAIAHTLDERNGTKSLDHQTIQTFGFSLKSMSNLDNKRLLEYPLKQVLRYNALDVKWTDRLRQVRMPAIENKQEYLAEYQRKVRLAPTLVAAEVKGLPVDFEYAAKQRKTLDTGIAKLSGQIGRCPEVKKYNSQFGVFSPTNPDHVLKLMKEVCQRDEVREEDSRTGAVSWTSGEEALSRIPASEVPSAELILEHRGLSKLLSTYVLPIIKREIVCPDGLVRPKYSSMQAVTGRLAASDPNIQNWPKRKHKQIRGIIGSGPSKAFVALDYGQIEFRVVGMASGDPAIIAACWTGYDVHKHWAQRLVDLYPPQIDYIVDTFKIDWEEKGLKTLRQEMKNQWVFPQLFGSSLKGCAENLHLPEWVAKDLHAEFWDTFGQTKKWQERLLASYAKNLYVETLGGRRRRGPMTKNEIINMPIQGTAADIVTEAMCVISEMAFERDDDHLQPALNVHDDLSFLIPDATESGLLDRIDLIATEMCRHRFDYINVPLVVEASIGVRWNELEELHVYRSNELFGLTQPGK